MPWAWTREETSSWPWMARGGFTSARSLRSYRGGPRGRMAVDRPVDRGAARRDAREDVADRFAQQGDRGASERLSGPEGRPLSRPLSGDSWTPTSATTRSPLPAPGMYGNVRPRRWSAHPGPHPYRPCVPRVCASVRDQALAHYVGVDHCRRGVHGAHLAVRPVRDWALRVIGQGPLAAGGGPPRRLQSWLLAHGHRHSLGHIP